MIEQQSSTGPMRIYDEDETKELFAPLRDRIFDSSEGGISFVAGPVFRQDHWIKVIIRGGLHGSNRAEVPTEPYSDLAEWARDDPRDELGPLLEILVEDGVLELIQMSPHTSTPPIDAVTVRPTRSALKYSWFCAEAIKLHERLVFDRTGRWGLYASEEEFGLLGGEPEFMARYIERAGGMDFIREKADDFWQHVLDFDGFEARYVSRYYALAGWDNPPKSGNP